MKKFDLQKSMHHGRSLIHAGIYKIPRDMPEDMAARAERDGLGVFLPEEPAKPAPRQTIRVKGPAPENKAQQGGGAAPQTTFPVAGETKGLG